MVDRQFLRIGVVGAGVMGERHARVFASLSDAHLVGIFDPDRARAAEVATRHGGTVFACLDDLLRQVDAVSIASLTSTHADVALQALDANVHLLIEKPLAASLADAKRIVDMARSRPHLTVMVGHIERFNPATATLCAALHGQTIQSITSRRTSPSDTRSLDTDVIHDLMIHDIDLVLDLMGDDVASVDAEGSIIYSGFIDSAVAQFEMDSGLRATMIASRAARRKAREIVVTTDRGKFIADLLGKSVTFHPHRSQLSVERYPVPDEEPLAIELRHFVVSVAAGDTPLVDAVAGHRAMIYAASISSLIKRGTSRYPLIPADQAIRAASTS